MSIKNIDLVIGLGEIGVPILNILEKGEDVIGYDIDPTKMNSKKYQALKEKPILFLHICIPFTKNFVSTVVNLAKVKKPKAIVIHSTIEPYTTQKIQKLIDIPVIYSATRGVHKRMISDMKKYTKFYALEKSAPNKKWASQNYSNLLKKCGIKSKKMSDPITLELAKIIVDTSYYGWLINYAQLSNMIAKKHKVDYDEMWSFADEIQKYLRNRPKMFPGFIGGHCVIPNLSLINEESLWQIDKINNLYVQKVKDAKSIAKKYVKGQQSYDV